jgi:hypothetical protein
MMVRLRVLFPLLVVLLWLVPAGPLLAQRVLVPGRDPFFLNDNRGMPVGLDVTLMDGSSRIFDISHAKLAGGLYSPDPSYPYNIFVLPQEGQVRHFVIMNAPRDFGPFGTMIVTVPGEPWNSGRYVVNPGFSPNDYSLMGPLNGP